MADTASHGFHGGVGAPPLVVKEALHTRHRDRARHHEGADVGTDTFQLFEGRSCT
jgi:hypothetical protein